MAYVTDGTTTQIVSDIEVKESTNELDKCIFLTDAKYADNIALTINYDYNSFVGFQKDVEQRGDHNVMYNITAREKAVEMQYVILTSGGETTFNKTDTASNLVAFAVAAVNTAYGYSGGDAWTVDAGSSDSTSLTIGCYYTNAMAFLKKVVIDSLGKKLWFESSTKKVYFRDYYNDLSASNLVYIKKVEVRDSNKRGCDKVIVIGQNSSITGSSGTGNLIRVFEYPSATTAAECNVLAGKLLTELGSTNVQWTVTLDTSASVQVADKIKLDGTIYVVTEKVSTFDKIVIKTGAVGSSIIDTLGTSITEVTGETVVGTDAQWSGGNTNVAANAAAYTEYTFDVKDVNLISNAYLDARVSSFIKSVSVSATNAYLSDITNVSSTSSAAAVASYGSNPYYYPDGSYLTCSGMTNGWQWGEISFFADMFGITSSRQLTLQFMYSTDTVNWYTLGEEFKTTLYLISGNSEVVPVYHHVYFNGSSSSSAIYFRCNIYSNGGASTVGVYSYSRITAVRIPRHLHSITDTSTYDKTTTGTPPSTLTIKVNSGSDTTLTPGTPINIQSLLITGKNVIYVKTPASSGNQCSVNPTITYQTLGKS